MKVGDAVIFNWNSVSPVGLIEAHASSGAGWLVRWTQGLDGKDAPYTAVTRVEESSLLKIPMGLYTEFSRSRMYSPQQREIRYRILRAAMPEQECHPQGG